MNIDELIDIIEKYPTINISRGTIIDLIAHNKNVWILTLKALLIKNTALYVHKQYLLDKLNYMKRNPIKPYLFLDIQGLMVYQALIML